MKKGLSKKNYMTPGEVSELLMVSGASIRLWAEKGDLNSHTTPGGHRRFLHSDVANFAKQKGMVLINSNDHRRKILIVDDNKPFADMLTKLFRNYGDEVEVDVVYNGFDAGMKLQQFKPDIILLDLLMPGLDGFQVCETIKQSESTKDVRVIAMTGYASEENVNKILQAGAERCLVKPFEPEVILKLVGLQVSE